MLTTDLAGVFRCAIERVGLSLQVDCPPLPELVYVDREVWEKIVVLEQAGASVIAVSCASEAIAALTQSHADVLLSDIGMPDLDDYMLIRQIKALPPEQGGQVKAIALTAYAGDFNQQEALQAGFQRHLAKPIQPEQWVNAIIQAVAQ